MSTRISRAVWAAKLSDPQAKLVLLKLADCADDKGVCWPFVSTIAADTELSDRTVRRKMELLETSGWLVRDRVKNGVTYTIKIPAKGDTVTALGVTHSQPLNGPKGDTVTGADSLTPCHGDRSGVTHRPVGGDTVTVTITKEPPRTTNEPPLKSVSAGAKADQEKSEQALKIVEAYPRREKVALALTIIRKDLESGESFQEILAKTKAIASVLRTLPSGASNRYIPGAEAFFRDKRWQDDPETFRRLGESFTNQPATKKGNLTSADVGI